MRVSLFLFLLCFPKGGIKIGGCPITWGYLTLAIGGLLTLIRPSWRFNAQKMRCLCALLPFWLALLMTFALYGTQNLPYTWALLISFVLLPLLILFTDFDHIFTEISAHDLEKWLERGLLFVALYGIALFCLKLLTGEFLEIPLLTINWGDRGLIALKSIQRGDYFKLISTYNNGNLYGICLLMLIPLIPRASLVTRALLYLSLLLSLSRTVWAGLLFLQAAECLFYRRKSLFFFLLASGLCLLLMAIAFQLPLDFFFDRTFGGRDRQFAIFHNLTLFGAGSFAEIKESVPLGILESFGVVGMATFLIGAAAPLFLISTASIRLSLMTYYFVSLSDGALLFIPTMAFFWLIVSRGISTYPPNNQKVI